MLEILLIVFSVRISNRFSQAGQKGAKKYILGIWMTYLGALVLAVICGGVADSFGSEGAMLAVIYSFLIIGYVVEIIIACRGMSHGKRLLQEMPARNYGTGYQYQQEWGQPQPYPQPYPPPYPQQYVPAQQQGLGQQPSFQNAHPQQNPSSLPYAPAPQGINSVVTYCANCATPLIEGAKFCNTCGTPVAVLSAPTISQTPSIQTAPIQTVQINQAQQEAETRSNTDEQRPDPNDLMSALSLANGAIGFSSSGSSTDAFRSMGFKVMDFRSETEKQAEKSAHLPLESELEVYANEIADAFVEYDGSSIFAEEKTKAKVRPIGEKLNDNEKQLSVYHRAVAIAASRGIRISSSTMERFWEGCGGWQV